MKLSIRIAQSRILPVAVKRCDRTIIEGLQDIVVLLEAQQFHPLVQAESSFIVDVLYRPEYLFQPGSEARKKCEDGEFIRRLIKHIERLLKDKEKILCIQVLITLRQMMNFDVHNGEKVLQYLFKVNELHQLTFGFINRETH